MYNKDIERLGGVNMTEYDCINPKQLYPTLGFKDVIGLYSGGQFNGSSGYEEAACQGLVALIRSNNGDAVEAVSIGRQFFRHDLLCFRFLFFCFSVRSIRNAPSPLPRRPARRYRLRTLCTDPESNDDFQGRIPFIVKTG